MYKNYLNINNKKVPVIIGGKGGCFPPDTIVSTLYGSVFIKDLRVGDPVFCYSNGKKCTSTIEKVWIHDFSKTPDKLINLYHKYGKLTVTDNHYIYINKAELRATGQLVVGDSLLLPDNTTTEILNITLSNKKVDNVYNLTVKDYHNYIADNIRVSNKGGGKGGGGVAAPGVEDPNSLFSTDILFLTIALGEGPTYRINSNGPQDIEINEGSIDSMLNLDSDGSFNTEFLKTDYRTGTITQSVMPVFGEETVVPQTMSNAISLKKGNLSGVPRTAVELQNTSANAWDSLRFNFSLSALQAMDTSGNIFASSITVKVTVYDNTGTIEIAAIEREISGKTNANYSFGIDIIIPEEYKSSNGYKFTVEKVSDDSDSSKVQDSISFTSWDEITNDKLSYPRTALIGYAIKAHSEYTGGVPTFTCMVKGLLCKVPANYNQPILQSGEIDWRQIEVPESGTNGYTTNGYRLQKTGATILYDSNPTIYEGLWDGTFTYAWTQNPVWIVYDLLTNTTYGLGIPESRIDKFKFYKVAQYCDGVDPRTGKWYGVNGIADGTYRSKPLGLFTEVRQALLGLNNGTSIKERRFTCDLVISSQKQVVDTITQIAGIFRAMLYYSAGKITLNVDMPDELPVAVFNETNIKKDSLTISGIRESEILTGVEVSYIEPNNHHRREIVRVDDPRALKELNQIENVTQIDLVGVSRRSQAIRFAQYLLASSKYIRRKATFKVSSEAGHITVGDVVSISQRAVGTSWGYSGRVFSNATIGSSNVVLEHFTSPAMTSSTFTGNTNPLALRVLVNESDRIDLYLLSNSVYTASSANVQAGIDLAEVQIISRFKPQTKTFSTSDADIQFSSNNAPTKNSLWTLGEIDPSNYLSSTSDKLFKVTALDIDNEELVTIEASEYVSNVYTDSDSLINYTPVIYKDTISPLIAPPTPNLSVRPIPTRKPDGTISYDLVVDAYTDTTGYPLKISTEYEYLKPTYSTIIESMY